MSKTKTADNQSVRTTTVRMDVRIDRAVNDLAKVHRTRSAVTGAAMLAFVSMPESERCRWVRELTELSQNPRKRLSVA
jgi:predicted transcriptional regulator